MARSPKIAKQVKREDFGRPSKYDPSFVDAIDKYLLENQDEHIREPLKTTEMRYEGKGKKKKLVPVVQYETRFKVKLPTIEGFAQYLGVVTRTIYNWADEHPDFLHALDKITQEQKRRLLQSGLSGEYNSTIAKLVLSVNHGMNEKNTTEVVLPKPILDVFNNHSNKESSDAE